MPAMAWTGVVGAGLGLMWTMLAGCGGSPPPAQATERSAADEAVLRDPVLDAVVNPNATRSPLHGTPTDHRQELSGMPPTSMGPTAQARPTNGVGVRGITGSLTAFEVDEAMNTRADALMACVQQRPNRLGHVAGDIKFHFAVDARGKVERVRITQSDIGHAALEQCLTDVVANAPFPAPAGAERAEAAWGMSVDPLARPAEPIDPAELEDAITRQAEATYETCNIGRARRFVVTGYLSHGGKLGPVSLRSPWRGPARTHDDAPEEIECLSQALSEWRHLPKPARITKASFELHWVAAPAEPRARNRARNKNKPRKKR